MQSGSYITVADGQTMLDLGMKHYGCSEGEFVIAQDNNVAPGHDLQPGDQVFIRDEVPELTADNVSVAAHFAGRLVDINRGYIPGSPGDYDSDDFNNDFL